MPLRRVPERLFTVRFLNPQEEPHQKAADQGIQDGVCRKGAVHEPDRNDQNQKQHQQKLAQDQAAEIVGDIERLGSLVDQKGGGEARAGENSEESKEPPQKPIDFSIDLPRQGGFLRKRRPLFESPLGQPGFQYEPSGSGFFPRHLRLNMRQINSPVSLGHGFGCVGIADLGLIPVKKILQVEDVWKMPSCFHVRNGRHMLFSNKMDRRTKKAAVEFFIGGRESIRPDSDRSRKHHCR